jgi:predicted DNA-binding mobile mystery protein A
MSLKQLGKRIGISPQAVLELETREREESITIAKLRQAADALNCDVRIMLVPRTSLEETVRGQAEMKVREERNRLVHTMRLENQEEGVEHLHESGAADRWLSERAARLWD